MKFFKKIFFVFLIMVCLCFIFIMFFLITDRGVYLMLRTFVSWVPGLKIGIISGNFLHGVTLKNISYQKYGVLIESTELYFSVDLRYLWDKHINVNSIFFKDVLIHINKSSNFDAVLLVFNESKTIHRILNLYTLACRNIILNNISIKLDEMVIILNNCHSGFIWDKTSCIISPTFFSELKLFNCFSLKKYYHLPYMQPCSLKKILSYKSFISSIVQNCFSQPFLKKKT